MKKEIIINASRDRARIAIVEDGELVELFVEHPDKVRTIGNIFLGKIQKVKPEIRAAFVDIGEKQDAFLHFSDLTDNLPELLRLTGEDIPVSSKRMLSKAPKKQVSEDESEASVEDKLDVESEDERRARRRKRRPGRGRDDAGMKAKEEEEEEVERPRRSGFVIDLSSKPPAPRKRTAPDVSTDAGADVAVAEEDKPSKPKARSRTAKKEEASETPETGDAVAETEEKPKPKPRSRRKKSTDETAEADTADAKAEATSEDEDEPKPARKSRSRRTTKKEADDISAAKESDEAADTEAVADPDAPAKPARRSSRRKAAEPKADEVADETADGTADSATSDADDDEDSDDDGTQPRKRRRGRRGGRRRKRRSTTDQDDSDDSAEDDAKDAPVADAVAAEDATDAEEKPRTRGRRSSRRSSEAKQTEETTEKSDDDKPAARGRSRRRSGQDDSDSSTEDSPKRERSSSGRFKKADDGPTKRPEEYLRRGGRILVKLTKEPISAKGSRVSTDISLAGRFLVLVPAADYVAVSKKIASSKERRRLKNLAGSLKPDDFGVIVRTVAEDRDAKVIETDLNLLLQKWRKIEKQLEANPNEAQTLYEDVTMVSSVLRDLFSDDFDRILVDDQRTYRNVRSFVQAVAPDMVDNVKQHTGNQGVFRAVGIEEAVERAFSSRVNLKSGGYLFIETTEAMHVVDVNSGRAGRGLSQSENLLNVNLEAAREIAKQLRLRDLGGIIVIDFIDMRLDSHRKKVYDELRKAFQRDRAVTKLLPMSDFGLIEITRQRLRPSITADNTIESAGAGEIAQEGQSTSSTLAAPRADASGQLTVADAVDHLEAWLKTYRDTVEDRYRRRPIRVRLHPLLSSYLHRGLPSLMMRWRFRFRGLPIRYELDEGVDPLSFDVRDEKSGMPLTRKYAQS
ncbi:hypothetical protein BH23BAC4_BH23BAC4_17820 [soil metagenome]